MHWKSGNEIKGERKEGRTKAPSLRALMTRISVYEYDRDAKISKVNRMAFNRLFIDNRYNEMHRYILFYINLKSFANFCLDKLSHYKIKDNLFLILLIT